MKHIPALLLPLLFLAVPAHAELQFSLYGGMNESFGSDVETHKGGVNDTRHVSWKGDSFSMPPYWGARATWWFNNTPNWGVAVDYTHTKAVAKIDLAADATYDRLEFTNGMNLLILTPMYRFTNWVESGFVPYVGFGLGIAVPHEEVNLDAFPSQHTYDYMLTGVAAQILAGMEYRLGKHFSVFGEGKLSYADVDSDLTGGGTLQTHILSPQVAVGISYRFGGP